MDDYLTTFRKQGWVKVYLPDVISDLPDAPTLASSLITRIQENLASKVSAEEAAMVRLDKPLDWLYSAATRKGKWSEQSAKAFAPPRHPLIARGDGMGTACNIYDEPLQLELERALRPIYEQLYGLKNVRMELERCSLRGLSDPKAKGGAGLIHVDMALTGDPERKRGVHDPVSYWPGQRIQCAISVSGDCWWGGITRAHTPENHRELCQLVGTPHAKAGSKPTGPVQLPETVLQALSRKGLVMERVHLDRPLTAIFWDVGIPHCSLPPRTGSLPALKVYANYSPLPDVWDGSLEASQVSGLGNHSRPPKRRRA